MNCINTSSTSSTRLIWLDIARGICILLMVICHASSPEYKFLAMINGITGVFFLVFFFFAAGICFNHTSNIKTYLFKQLKKCLLPYLILSTAFIVKRIYQYSIIGDFKHRIINGIASIIFAYSNDFEIGGLHTVGVGPIWFLCAFFLSTVMYKVIDNNPKRNIIVISIAFLSSISQQWITLPFALQPAAIGMVFILLGDQFKSFWLNLVNFFNGQKAVTQLFISILAFCITMILTWITSNISQYINGEFLDLGSNNYSFLSLITSISGFIFVLAISNFIERTKILDDMLAFVGKETFLILILHSIDITLLRNWGARDKSFIGFAVLLYPFLAYTIRRIENTYFR